RYDDQHTMRCVHRHRLHQYSLPGSLCGINVFRNCCKTLILFSARVFVACVGGLSFPLDMPTICSTCGYGASTLFKTLSSSYPFISSTTLITPPEFIT